MVVGAKVCELTDGFLWFVCGLCVGILRSPLNVTYLLPAALGERLPHLTGDLTMLGLVLKLSLCRKLMNVASL